MNRTRQRAVKLDQLRTLAAQIQNQSVLDLALSRVKDGKQRKALYGQIKPHLKFKAIYSFV